MSTTTRLVTMTAIWALALATALFATPTLAQVRYKDSEGVTHWVNSKDEVPEQYRAGAVGGPVPRAKPSGTDWEGKAREADRRAERERAQAERGRAQQAW